MIVIYQSSEEKNKNKFANPTHKELIKSNIHNLLSNSNFDNNKSDIESDISKTTINEFKDSEIFNDYINNLLNKIEIINKQKYVNVDNNIQVNDVLGKVALFYEKIRTTIEYKGEHLFRRNAIERILKRMLWDQGRKRSKTEIEDISENLIKELIWARYLPNNEIQITKIDDVKKVILKYIYIFENLKTLPVNVSYSKTKQWIIGISSSEIEDLLDPSNREIYINMMYEWFLEKYDWKDKQIEDQNKNIQIYIAIHRAFAKSDDPIIRYYLLLKENNNWNNASLNEIDDFIINLPKLYEDIENCLNFKDRLLVYRKLSQYATIFEIFRQLCVKEKNDIKNTLKEESNLNQKVVDICDENYKLIKKKVNTGIIRSIIYIFITKVVFAMLLEVPFEIFRYGDLNYLPLSINIIFPPFMMFIIGMSIKIPGNNNTDLILLKLKSIIYKVKINEKYIFSLNISKTKNTLITTFGVIYFLLIISVFALVSSFLLKLGYSFFGLIVFFFFLSLVILFAFRIRYHSQKLRVIPEKEDLLSHLISYLTLPFINLGYYLSRLLSKINIFTLFLDIIIEAPLKIIMEIFEEWIRYIREKKQEVIEVPE